MSVYIITGEQGEGKGIMAMLQIEEALKAGKRVVTNIDLSLENFGFRNTPLNVERVSDFPSAQELWSLGKGCAEYNEKKFGLIVLDEMGIYLNSRNFKDAGRDEFIKWLRHVRKLHWDLMLLVQSADSLDKQIRGGLAHYQVKCKAGDKMTVPLISPIVKFFTGRKVTMPKFHAGVVNRGFGANFFKVDVWITRGTQYYKCYDTGQQYPGGQNGVSTLLCPVRTPGFFRPESWEQRRYDFYQWALKHEWVTWFLPLSWAKPPAGYEAYISRLCNVSMGTGFKMYPPGI